MDIKDKPFLVPWGSESICYWCKNFTQGTGCKFIETEKEKTLFSLCLVDRQLLICPFHKLELDENKNLQVTQGRPLKPRYGY